MHSVKRLVLPLVVIVAVAAVVVRSQAQQARPNADRQKWEYAQWSIVTVKFDKPMTHVTFKSPDRYVLKDGQNPSWDVFTELGGKAEQRRYDIQNVMQLLGEDGWELVQMHDDNGDRVRITNYFFKRPKN
jgi:hypothetical protein